MRKASYYSFFFTHKHYRCAIWIILYSCGKMHSGNSCFPSYWDPLILQELLYLTGSEVGHWEDTVQTKNRAWSRYGIERHCWTSFTVSQFQRLFRITFLHTFKKPDFLSEVFVCLFCLKGRVGREGKPHTRRSCICWLTPQTAATTRPKSGTKDFIYVSLGSKGPDTWDILCSCHRQWLCIAMSQP